MFWVEKLAVFSPATITVLLSILDELVAALWMNFGTRWSSFCCSFPTDAMWAFADLERLTYIFKFEILFRDIGVVLIMNLFFFEFIKAGHKFFAVKIGLRILVISP